MSKDTLELLRECDSGIKMAVGSIDEVSGHIKDEDLKNLLEKSKEEHSQLGGTIKEQLASLIKSGADAKDYTLTEYVNDINRENTEVLTEYGADGKIRKA